MKRKLEGTENREDNVVGSENQQDSAILNTEPTENEKTVERVSDDPKKKKKRYSPIWKHFTIETVETSGSKKDEIAHCNYCAKTYTLSGKSNGSTSNLNRHLKTVHTDLCLTILEPVEEVFVFSQERYRAALIKWIVTCNQPFTEIEQVEFLELIRTLNPDAITVSSETVKRDVMEKFETKVREIKLHLSKVPGKISFSVDAWTSKNVLSFMAIRAHWITTDWNYETVLLDFSYIDGSHSGENLCDIFLQCLKRFEIPLSKVMAVTMDNATSGDTFMDCLQRNGIEIGENLSAAENRVRCMPHIINLAVQDILEFLNIPLNYENDVAENLDDEEEEYMMATEEDEEEEAEDENEDENEDEYEDEDEGVEKNKPIILKLRKLVRKVRKSTQMRQKLREHCQVFGIKYLVPKIDVSTRWNSTFEMLERAETLKIPLRALCLSEKKLEKLLMNEREWSALNCLKALLQKFDRSTKLLSMERHPTISAYLPTLNWLLESLEQFINENPGPSSEAAKKGFEKMKKYEEQLQINRSQIPYVATFLNPALKMCYFKEHDYSKPDLKEIQKIICERFEKIYVVGGNSATAEKSEEETPDEFFCHMFKRSKTNKQPKEFQKYLNFPLSGTKVDILDYWRSQKDELPNLSKMARDYLAIQSGSVSVERDFSGGVDLVTPTRCSLQAQAIRACMCLKSWFKFQRLQSHLSSSEHNLSNDS